MFMVGFVIIQICNCDDLRGPHRVRVGVIDDADAALRAIATAVDYFSRNIRVLAHVPKESRRGLPNRDPFVPTQKVQPA
jgi:hypothetical protein